MLLLLAAIISGKAVLPQPNASDIDLTALAGLLTLVCATGLLFRPTRRVLGMGVDSLTVLLLYLLGVAELVAMT